MIVMLIDGSIMTESGQRWTFDSFVERYGVKALPYEKVMARPENDAIKHYYRALRHLCLSCRGGNDIGEAFDYLDAWSQKAGLGKIECGDKDRLLKNLCKSGTFRGRMYREINQAVKSGELVSVREMMARVKRGMERERRYD